MTLAEFKAWFEGFNEGIPETPTPEQWAKIKAKIAATVVIGPLSQMYPSALGPNYLVGAASNASAEVLHKPEPDHKLSHVSEPSEHPDNDWYKGDAARHESKLGLRAINFLINSGLDTCAKIAAMSDRQMRSMGAGPKTVKQIRAIYGEPDAKH